VGWWEIIAIAALLRLWPIDVALRGVRNELRKQHNDKEKEA
jgi:hypothetical protein